MYGCALFYAVFLTPNRYRGDESARINLLPLLRTVKLFHIQGNEHFWPYYIGYWGNIFGNIILFAPFGFLFKGLYARKSSLSICAYGCLLSVIIEGVQLILRIGVCDIDDIILNVLGVAAGLKLYRIIKKWRHGLFVELE